MPSVNIAIFPKCNSVSMTPATPNFNVLGQAPYADTIQDWQYPLPYVQKINFDDELVIQVHVADPTALSVRYQNPKLYICDYQKNVINTIDLNVTPFLKGYQLIPYNTYIDPVTGATYPLLTAMWSFKFSDLDFSGDYGGIYYLKMVSQDYPPATVNTFTTFFSEPMFVDTSHQFTKQFQFAYNTNNSLKNIVVSGWFDDYPTNTQQYSPIFSQRAEAYINMFSPKVINIGYLQQQYQQKQIKAQQVRSWKLKVGEISLGIPYYMLEMLTEALLADTVTIDGYAYILYNPTGQSSLADLWKIRDADVVPLVFGECALMERYNSQSAIVTPTPSPYGRIFTSEFDTTFD